MEALNAARLTPVSVLSDRRNEPKKVPSFQFKNLPNSANVNTNYSRNVHGGLVLLSSVFTTNLAKALTYEEALQQSTTSTDFDANALVETVTNFVSENPSVIAAAVAVLALPLVLSQVFSKKPKPWGVESAKKAYAKLGDDESSELLDIRGTVELRQVGSPDIKGLKKKPVNVVYKGEDKPGFLNKLALKFKEPENTTLFILDKFDGNSELAAELATANGFKAAYAIKDGAEGPRGWKNSGLPWILPKKTLSLDLGLSDALDGILGDGSDAVTVGLGVAAAAGLGLLVFSEVETVLQLLGSAALIQLVSKKLLFAEDRKQSLQQVDEFLTKEVAPKELAGDIKQIGMALLPVPVNSKALPAPAEKTESVPEVDVPSSKVEASVEPTPEINSDPEPEVKVFAFSFSEISESLSPYPNYPDLKPPTSPIPSQPSGNVEKMETVSKVEISTESTPEVNSVPKPEETAEALSGITRSLSPYPNYPDLKPPTSPIPSQPSGSVKKTETVSKVELSSESTPEINSIPKPEVTAEALNGNARPLSPYPNYPDLKPPTSPMPTQA
ncbi:rhodanese-like domain-containing protein 4, chloroplastic [Lycium ferocissimum]|uniref:rhodanese-like domain-containing protein 4, chloroplastic n=1 Tax=Lycium ferocissimum TaxID=112874 RepID=UPI002814B036|nr:rhodanese-like domain-containing protein 4, chloroplastic [Lycium ferocissimum]